MKFRFVDFLHGASNERKTDVRARTARVVRLLWGLAFCGLAWYREWYGPRTWSVRVDTFSYGPADEKCVQNGLSAGRPEATVDWKREEGTFSCCE